MVTVASGLAENERAAVIGCISPTILVFLAFAVTSQILAFYEVERFRDFSRFLSKPLLVDFLEDWLSSCEMQSFSNTRVLSCTFVVGCNRTVSLVLLLGVKVGGKGGPASHDSGGGGDGFLDQLGLGVFVFPG